MASLNSWKVFDSELPMLTYEYSFGPGTANALAVGGEGGLIVASPPYRAADSAFNELASHGPVRALIATNAFHHMGIPEWKERFPDAEIYAPAQSIARVEGKTKLHGILPVGRANGIAGPHLEFVDMPFYRTGEALIKIRTGRGLAWHVTDIILNITELPKPWLIRFLFKISGSGPGLCYNNIGPRFMVRDLPALKKWLAEEYAKDRPRWLSVSHGEIADLDATPLQR